MARRTKRIALVSAVVLLGAGGWFIYGLLAAQGQGELAQAPLNSVTQTPPAFIMAVDDSNSMTFERIFPGGDGRMQWNGSSFFSSAGVFHNVGEGCANNSTDCYVYLFPHTGYNASYSPGAAIPPLDVLGFARSPAYNAGYFNPEVTYEPWRRATGDASGNALWPVPAANDVRADPRTGGDFATANGVSYDMRNSRAVNGEAFRFQVGMVLPAGTRYRSNGRTCNTTTRNGLPSTSDAWRALDQDTAIAATCTVQMEYFPATFYLPAAAAAPAGYLTNDANRPVISNACGPGCNMRRYEIKPANYATTAAYNDALRNFSIWFQYHHNRILSMVGSSSHAMAEVNNMRVGYFTINALSPVTMHDVATARENLYTQIYSLKPNGGTPNRQAVKYLGDQFRRTDDGAPVIRACQRNGGMLFTDGYTNTTSTVSGYGNADSVGGTHFPTIPFADIYSNTIADIAAAYYSSSNFTPLRTGADFPVGQVPVDKRCDSLDKSSAEWKRLDCQKDLHMNFYGVTLGAQGRIFEVNQAQTDDPYANAPNWNANGSPTDADDGRVIDEIWHGAVNSRGEFINAKTPNEVTDAMRRVLSSVTGGATPSGTFALSGARIGVGSLAVVPRYDVASITDWSSRLFGQQVTVNPTTREAQFTQIWEASAKMPAAASRNVWFASGNNVTRFGATTISLAGLCSTPKVQYPGFSVCTESDLAALGATASSAASYLLGSTATEVRLGGKFRDRSTVLGDIVNSTPIISAASDDYGYRALGAPYAATYTAYLATKRSSRRTMVYVGANDGMLHAFDGGMDGTGTVNGNGGAEVFGYIPATAYGHMGNLLYPNVAASKQNQKFQHRYYVDGPIAVGDTYSNGGWKTSLVGTAGAGGRSVFALDVSNPTGFAASSRLWEINDINSTDAVKANIGHVLGKPVIVPVRDKDGVSWKAIFGNGYSSASGKAVLFVVDMTASPRIRMIEAAESGNAIAGKNGLGNIMVVDRVNDAELGTDGKPRRVRDGYADTVYAADQKGAIWKFDLLSDATSVSVPVFTTGTFTEGGLTFRQPITGGLQATAGESGGVLLMFGTGSFSFSNDGTDKTTVQSLYGVNDLVNGPVTTTLTRARLQSHAVTTTGGARTLTKGTNLTGSIGWYIDLPPGERSVGYPALASGILFIPTYAPQGTTGCSTTGANWLFGLNPRNGTGALSNVRMGSISNGTTVASGTAGLALDTGGNAPVKDVGVSVVPRLAPPTNPNNGTPAPGVPEGAGCWMNVSVAGAVPMYVPYPCGRQSWRQIQ